MNFRSRRVREGICEDILSHRDTRAITISFPVEFNREKLNTSSMVYIGRG